MPFQTPRDPWADLARRRGLVAPAPVAPDPSADDDPWGALAARRGVTPADEPPGGLDMLKNMTGRDWLGLVPRIGMGIWNNMGGVKGAAMGAAGELGGQAIDQRGFRPLRVLASGAIGAFPFGKFLAPMGRALLEDTGMLSRGINSAANIAAGTAKGGALGLGTTAADTLISEGRFPTGTEAKFGAILGAGGGALASGLARTGARLASRGGPGPAGSASSADNLQPSLFDGPTVAGGRVTTGPFTTERNARTVRSTAAPTAPWEAPPLNPRLAPEAPAAAPPPRPRILRGTAMYQGKYPSTSVLDPQFDRRAMVSPDPADIPEPSPILTGAEMYKGNYPPSSALDPRFAPRATAPEDLLESFLGDLGNRPYRPGSTGPLRATAAPGASSGDPVDLLTEVMASAGYRRPPIVGGPGVAAAASGGVDDPWAALAQRRGIEPPAAAPAPTGAPSGRPDVSGRVDLVERMRQSADMGRAPQSFVGEPEILPPARPGEDVFSRPTRSVGRASTSDPSPEDLIADWLGQVAPTARPMPGPTARLLPKFSDSTIDERLAADPYAAQYRQMDEARHARETVLQEMQSRPLPQNVMDLPPEEARELRRILAEMEEFRFERGQSAETFETTFGERLDQRQGWRAGLLPHTAGAPVFNDIMGDTKGTRQAVINAIQRYLDGRKLSPIAARAVQAARRRLGGDTGMGKAMLPPDAGDLRPVAPPTTIAEDLQAMGLPAPGDDLPGMLSEAELDAAMRRLLGEDRLPTGEVQPRLPGDVGRVRDLEQPLPPVAPADDVFRMTAPPETMPTQGGLLAGAAAAPKPKIPLEITRLWQSLKPKWQATAAAQQGQEGFTVDPTEDLLSFARRVVAEPNRRNLWGAERQVVDQLEKEGRLEALRKLVSGDDGGPRRMTGEEGGIDPALLYRLGATGAGAVAGPLLDKPDANPWSGAIAGGGLGLLASFLKKNPRLASDISSSSLFSGKAPLKSLAGNVGAGPAWAAEVSADFPKADPFRVLKEELFQRQTLDDVKEGWRRNVVREGLEPPPGSPFAYAGKAIGAPDFAARQVIGRAQSRVAGGGLPGIPSAQQADIGGYYTLSGDPLSKFGDWFVKGVRKFPAAQVLVPVARTATNFIERGLERTPVIGGMKTVRAWTGASDAMVKRRQALGALAMLASLGAGAASETVLPDEGRAGAFKEAMPFLSAAASVFGLPVAASAAGGQAAVRTLRQSGRPDLGGVPLSMLNAVLEGAPLPSGYDITGGDRFVPNLLRRAVPYGALGRLISPVDPRTLDLGSSRFGPALGQVPFLNEWLYDAKPRPRPRRPAPPRRPAAGGGR
jgi:hypothetical protein